MLLLPSVLAPSIGWLLESLYLSNMLNFDPIMPAFFLYYQEGKLLGLLTVYADNEDVEVSFLVDPSYRRHGIARAMYRSFEKEMASYPIRSVTFQTERFFLDHHPDLAISSR